MNEKGTAPPPRLFDPRRLGVALGVCLLLAPAASARAQVEALPPQPQPPEQAPEAMPAPGGPQNPLELEAWLDGVIEAQLDALHVPGAVASVVSDGKVLLAKGWGYADVARQAAPDPERTLFRPGSVSKLVTWTALMQLVEQGLVDPKKNVNDYLAAFAVPATFPQPVTAGTLMTHTAGFEDHLIGLFTRSPKALLPLETYVRTQMPARIYPPGKIPAYSNYGAALAGYLVERVAKTPFDVYVQEHVFQPLGMTHSTFAQPLPEALAKDLAVGYAWKDGRYVPQDFELVQAGPAGALSTSAVDMAHFMIAQLEGGAYEGGRILQPPTVREMQAQHFTADPRVSGWTWGFMEMHLNGQRVLWHGGDTIYFHSGLVLFPEHRLGLFVSYNGAAGGKAVHALIEAFANRYFPVPAPAPLVPPEGALRRAGRFTGDYRYSRSNVTGPEKILSLFMRAFVTATPKGALRLATSLGDPDPRYWAETDPLVFRELDGPDHLVFHEKEGEGVTEVLFENDPTAIGLKLPWWQGARFQLLVLLASLLLLASVLLAVPLGWLARRREAAAATLGPPPTRGASPALPRVAAFVTVLLYGGVFYGLSQVVTPETVYGLPPIYRTVRVLAWIAFALTLVLLAYAFTAWRKGWWGFFARVHYALVALAAWAVLAFLLYWRLF